MLENFKKVQKLLDNLLVHAKLKKNNDLLQNKKIIVINISGGPCTGKSVLAAYLFGDLRKLGYNCELVTEYARELVHRKKLKKLRNQKHVFKVQYKRQKIYKKSNVEILITDAPLHASLYYAKEAEQKFGIVQPKRFYNKVKNRMGEFINLNYNLERIFEFQSEGRKQKDKNEAIEVDKGIIEMFKENSIPYELVKPTEELREKIIKDLERLIKQGPDKNPQQDFTRSF